LYSLTYPFIIFDKIASILKNFLVSVTYVLTTKNFGKTKSSKGLEKNTKNVYNKILFNMRD
ncbi:MAG: hypothetical protein E6970_05400, partial [Peptostreptococcus sp.]|uniref:hypothetical protein n=1 Tax=Peptostreptococcus sp. TaxID=1262 RepID=UPI00290147C9